MANVCGVLGLSCAVSLDFRDPHERHKHPVGIPAGVGSALPLNRSGKDLSSSGGRIWTCDLRVMSPPNPGSVRRQPAWLSHTGCSQVRSDPLRLIQSLVQNLMPEKTTHGRVRQPSAACGSNSEPIRTSLLRTHPRLPNPVAKRAKPGGGLDGMPLVEWVCGRCRTWFACGGA